MKTFEKFNCSSILEQLFTVTKITLLALEQQESEPFLRFWTAASNNLLPGREKEKIVFKSLRDVFRMVC